MTQAQTIAICISIAITVVGTADYIQRIARGVAEPNIVSWLVWAIAPLLVAHVAYCNGASLRELARTLAAGGLSLVVVMTCVGYQQFADRLSKTDISCGSLAIGSMLLWSSGGLTYSATALALLADTLATIPTITRAWRSPRTESLSPYSAGLLSSLVALSVHEKVTLLSLVFPVYLVVLNVAIIVTLLLARNVTVLRPR
jgi:hypothetical protein